MLSFMDLHHHTIAEDCHVQMRQKPLAISPEFGRKIIVDDKKKEENLIYIKFGNDQSNI